MDQNGTRFESDEKLVSILRAIHEDDLHSVTKIADRTGIANSTVYGHLNSLCDYGFVERRDRKYHIGLRFLEYGVSIRNQHLLFRAAKDKIDTLAKETEERVWCVTEQQGKAVYLYGAAGNKAIQTHETIGEHTSLHDIAAGKAILAFLPDERCEEIIEYLQLERSTSNTITDPDALRDELETVWEEGVAFNFEESLEGLRSIGAPICKPDGGVYGAISFGGPANRLTRKRLETEFTDLILGTANEIEINIRHM